MLDVQVSSLLCAPTKNAAERSPRNPRFYGLLFTVHTSSPILVCCCGFWYRSPLIFPGFSLARAGISACTRARSRLCAAFRAAPSSLQTEPTSNATKQLTPNPNRTRTTPIPLPLAPPIVLLPPLASVPNPCDVALCVFVSQMPGAGLRARFFWAKRFGTPYSRSTHTCTRHRGATLHSASALRHCHCLAICARATFCKRQNWHVTTASFAPPTATAAAAGCHPNFAQATPQVTPSSPPSSLSLSSPFLASTSSFSISQLMFDGSLFCVD
jgi:hypothetical protein